MNHNDVMIVLGKMVVILGLPVPTGAGGGPEYLALFLDVSRGGMM